MRNDVSSAIDRRTKAMSISAGERFLVRVRVKHWKIDPGPWAGVKHMTFNGARPIRIMDVTPPPEVTGLYVKTWRMEMPS